MTIYLLDANKKAANYPESLVAEVNSTFSVFVDVENHEGQTVNETILVKVASSTNIDFPLNVTPTQSFNGILQDGKTKEDISTISLNQPGNYTVAFELWLQRAEGLQYSGNTAALNIEVKAPQNGS